MDTAAFVYIIQAESGPVKIGMTTNCEQRLSDLQVANYELLTLLFRIECESVGQATEIEQSLHERYQSQRIRGEWFDVSPNEIIPDIQLLISLAACIKGIEIEKVTYVRQWATSTSNAQAIIHEYLDANPDATAFTARELAALLKVGKTTVAEVLKQRKGQP